MRFSTVSLAMAAAVLIACGSSERSSGSATSSVAATMASSSSSSGSGGAGGGCAGTGGGVLLHDDFAGPNGAMWPAHWTIGDGVATADIQSNRGRLVPKVRDTYSLGRMLDHASASDVDVTFAVELTLPTNQGLGFYVRQNGGVLQRTPKHGAGYAVFIEGFSNTPGVGAWVENDGIESLLQQAPMTVAPNAVYRVRFRVTQADPNDTRLQIKAWPDGSAEPPSWAVDRTDADPALQNVAAGFAIDAWTSYTTDNPGTPSDLFISDVTVRAACP